VNGQFPLTSTPLPHAQDLCCALGFASRLIVLKQQRLKSRTNSLTVQLLRTYINAVKSHELRALLNNTLHFTSHCRLLYVEASHSLTTFVFPFIPCGLCQQSHTKFNPLNPELNPICCLLALLGAHHFLHVSRIKVKLLTFR